MASIWPAAPIEVHPRTKYLITRFFDISDTIDPDSGERFTDELFTEDGFFKTHETCVFRGREEIASSRKNLQKHLVSRAHEIIQVFAANNPATDLIVLGRFTINFKAGHVLNLDFTARIVVSQASSEDEARLQSVQVWTDSAPQTEAHRKAVEAERGNAEV